MTSMPASRSALAITLAPRSCPSKPGFATSTRILTSDIDNHLTTARAGNPRNPPDGGHLQSLNVQTPPHIPAGDAAVRLPGSGDLFHIFGLRQLPFSVMLLQSHLYAIVASGQDVWASQREHQEHVRRPHSDSFDLRQMLNHFVIG